jgi:hypothetical protein
LCADAQIRLTPDFLHDHRQTTEAPFGSHALIFEDVEDLSVECRTISYSEMGTQRISHFIHNTITKTFESPEPI